MSASESQDRSQVLAAKPNKLFITGLDGKSQLNDLQAELRKVFSKYGEILSVVPKKSFNQQYSYAFVDFKQDVDASVAIKKQNNTLIGGAKITVSIQDSSRRKKGAQSNINSRTEGCYKCGKPGHFARDCRSAGDKNNQRSSSRERSARKKKKKRKHSSDYSRSRSQSQRKKCKGKLRVNNRKKETFEIPWQKAFQEQEEQEIEAKKLFTFRLNRVNDLLAQNNRNAKTIKRYYHQLFSMFLGRWDFCHISLTNSSNPTLFS